MSLEKLYIQKIIDNDKYDYQSYLKTRDRIEKLEKYFEDVILYKQIIYKQQPKYYLQNKIKKDTKDIQENLRSEIDRLNHVYRNNFYYIDIDKSILSKKENKHTYNIFQISIIEYKHVNLLRDLIYESEFFYTGIMKPISYSNINDEFKLSLYEIIEDTLNLKEIHTDHDEYNDFYYHNNYFDFLRDTIYEFFIDIYKNDNAIKIKKLLTKIEPSSSCSTVINLSEILEHYYNENKFIDEINEILDIMVQENWSLDMNMLDYNLLIDIYTKCKEINEENNQ